MVDRNVRLQLVRVGLLAAVVTGVSACGNLANPPTRMGMVKDPATGLQFGSMIEKSFVTDSSFYRNKKIKVRTRNTSGDAAFDLGEFSRRLSEAYRAAGYIPTDGDDFGLLVDVNVLYSGQIQSNLANEFAFLGGAGGGIAGYRSSATAGTAIGILSGATLGSIIGSYITDDTYIVVANVSFGVIKERRRAEEKTITFSRSPKPGERRDEEEEHYRETVSQRGLRDTFSTRLAVYAGGRMTPQSAIVSEVRQRLIRVVKDII